MVERAEWEQESLREEIANSVIHGIGLLLAIVGLTTLVAFAAMRGTVWHVVSCSVFGGTLVFQYAASTVYHSVPHPRARPVLQAIDHSAIFLLIAGTYTPLTLVNLRGPWGFALFGAIWGLALLGLGLRFSVLRRARSLRVALYVAMGWLAVVATRPILDSVAPGGVLLLAAGGVAYTVGVVFYMQRRVRYSHAIWHAFVLIGSVLHYLAVLLYVVPA